MAARVPLDFDPPIRRLSALLLGVDDDDLTGPTPCSDWTVAALLDHLIDLSTAFTHAARKHPNPFAPAKASLDTPTDRPDHADVGLDPAGLLPVPSAAHLTQHWRSQLPELLEELAAAWSEPTAWVGTTRIGGVSLPATTVGINAMNELVVHSWDLARATDQEYATDPRIIEKLIQFLAARRTDPSWPGCDPGEPTRLEEALRLTGRQPTWTPPRRGHRAA